MTSLESNLSKLCNLITENNVQKKKEIPHLTSTYIEFCFTHSLEQIITRSTRIADQTATLIDHILTNSPYKVSQSDVIDLDLSVKT